MPETQKLPYKFEVSMFVKADGFPGVITHIDDDEPAVKVDGLTYGWYPTCLVLADIDHPGTRGILLQQYREASGHEHAVTLYSDGEWLVDPDPTSCSDGAVGRGESEGAAILDALNRLAASKTTAAADDACDGLTIDPVKLADRLSRIEATLAQLTVRVSMLDDCPGD